MRCSQERQRAPEQVGAYLVKRRRTAAEGGDTRIPARIRSGPEGTWLD